MPPDAPRTIVEELVTIAGRDLRAAELLASEPELVHAACFHSQQAVEKMLKAALLVAGAEPPRSHDLVFLLESLAAHRVTPPELFEVCAALADFGVAPRYPGWESGSGEVSPREAFESARTGFALLLPMTTAMPT